MLYLSAFDAIHGEAWACFIACVSSSKSRVSALLCAVRVYMEVLLSCPDLVETLLCHIDHASSVALGRTCSAARTAQRAAIRANPLLLAAAARNADRALTKTTLMGWFALTSREADALPRAVYARRRPGGGCYYLYRDDAFDRAATVVAARDGMWAERLDRRQSWAKAGELKRPPPAGGGIAQGLKRVRVGG